MPGSGSRHCPSSLPWCPFAPVLPDAALSGGAWRGMEGCGGAWRGVEGCEGVWGGNVRGGGFRLGKKTAKMARVALHGHAMSLLPLPQSPGQSRCRPRLSSASSSFSSETILLLRFVTQELFFFSEQDHPWNLLLTMKCK